MLGHHILSSPPEPDRDSIVTVEGKLAWGKLCELAGTMRQNYAGLAGRRLGLSFDPSGAGVAALAALDELGCDVFLFDASLPSKDLLELGRQFHLGAVLYPSRDLQQSALRLEELPDEAAWSGESSVTILTSGSTGKPKAVHHTWATLSRPVRRDADHPAPRWLLAYRPHLYAGLQVLLQCLINYGTLVVVDPQMDPRGVVEHMIRSEVQFVSATPSYWRRLLFSCEAELLRRIPIVQLTLGGEVVDQPLLNALRRTFPTARLVHIYATTELGRCFSVNDGKAGFPARLLQHISPDGVELRVEQDELLARSANAMRYYDAYSADAPTVGEWCRTGDLVDIVGDRVHFSGRKSDLINVGGQKVHPFEVEQVIQTIPGVRDVRVFAKSSSIVGQVVACEIVPETGQDTDLLKEIVRNACRAQLSAAQQPRFIQVVSEIALSPAGKRIRKVSS
jgi:acyl-CoA synthetase (AMP-forming)/AMP-acid ligase II